MSQSIDTYVGLVTGEHQDKPRFIAALTALVQGFVDQQNVIESMPAKYDLEQASGVQLDVVGVWVGITRNLRFPIPGVFFSFNTPNVGVNQGVWFEAGDTISGVTVLDDGTYRLMIKAKIAANTWNGTLEDANEKLSVVFPGGTVEVKDNLDMTMSLIISGDIPSTLFQQLVQQGYIELRPAGVKLV